MKFRQLIGLLLALALVAAACGSSGTETSDGGGGSGGDGSGLDIDAILAADLDNCAEAATGELIQIGMALDFSEVTGFVDIPGSMLGPFVGDKINCSGGVNGSPVEVRVAEVGDDAALAAQELSLIHI